VDGSARQDLAGRGTEDQAVSGQRCPVALPAHTRGTGALVSRVARPPRTHGALQGEHGAAGTGGLRTLFIIPGERIKNGEERLVVLNGIAKSVVESVRGLHPVYVFVHAHKKDGESGPVSKMNNTAWKAARERAADAWIEQRGEPAPAGFRSIRVHDLKHTCGRRLRAAGVSFEDRQDLLGHRGGRITTRYSQAELTSLIQAAEKVCDTEFRKTPAITWRRRETG